MLAHKHELKIKNVLSVFCLPGNLRMLKLDCCGAVLHPRALSKKEGMRVESTCLTLLMSVNHVRANSEQRNPPKTELSHRQPLTRMDHRKPAVNR